MHCPLFLCPCVYVCLGLWGGWVLMVGACVWVVCVQPSSTFRNTCCHLVLRLQLPNMPWQQQVLLSVPP